MGGVQRQGEEWTRLGGRVAMCIERASLTRRVREKPGLQGRYHRVQVAADSTVSPLLPWVASTGRRGKVNAAAAWPLRAVPLLWERYCARGT